MQQNLPLLEYNNNNNNKKTLSLLPMMKLLMSTDHLSVCREQLVENMRLRLRKLAAGGWNHLHAGAEIQTGPTLRIQTRSSVNRANSVPCQLLSSKQTADGRCFETMVTSWEENNKGVRVKEGGGCSLYVVNCFSTGRVKQSLNAIQLWLRKQRMEGLIKSR